MSKSQQGSSNIITVMKDFKNELELRRFAEAQHKTITMLQEKLSLLEHENKHLKEMLVHNPIVKNPIRIEITPEETIITEQIEFLRQASYQRVLTIEEVKKLDLLVKNLKLIKSEPTTIIGEKPKGNVTEAQLVEIASKHEPND